MLKDVISFSFYFEIWRIELKHIALYRKYRPLILEDVVGQSAVTDTIIHQIKSNKLSHAYLFSGPRGTGKTSVAKIISRAANCETRQDHNPCNKCSICKSILQDSFVDVTEMDAASNSGVDNIRSLIDSVKFPPSTGKYKVIIIDEAHMLTNEAENALLKTLEEPPKYMIFILATTEPNRIQTTIKSRCQRYDFRRISEKDICSQLAKVCQNEGIDAEYSVLDKIASVSLGGMRDALSTLEKVALVGNEKITLDILSDVLGSTDEDIYKLIAEIFAGNLKNSFEILNEFYTKGKDVKLLISEMIEILRRCLIIKSGYDIEKLNLSVTEKRFMSNDMASVTLAKVISVLDVFIAASNNRNAENLWASFELAVSKAATYYISAGQDNSQLITELIARIEVVEKKLQAGVKLSSGQLDSVDNNQQVVKQSLKEDAITTNKENEIASQVTETKVNINQSETAAAEKWQQLVELIKKENTALGSVVAAIDFVGKENNKIKITCRPAFKALKITLKSEKTMSVLNKHVKNVYNDDSVEIVYVD